VWETGGDGKIALAMKDTAAAEGGGDFPSSKLFPSPMRVV
jgi:hypothetical protein